jgi:hypothetical protein
MERKYPLVIAASGLALALGAAPALGADWEYGVELYALAADVKATSAEGEDISADFDDILDDLEFAVFGSLAAKRDKLSLFANLFYVDTESREREAQGPIKAELTVGLENLVSTFGAGWDFMDSGNTTLAVVGAARYLSMDVDLKLRIDPLGTVKESESGSNWDGVVGIRGKTELSDRWYLTYYADVGAGESDVTWQASTGINYRFEALDVTLGYQHLEWEFDDQLLDDLEISGPALGVKFFF